MAAANLLLLRELKGRPDSWILLPDWLSASELPADRLVALNTASNELSMYSCDAERLQDEKLRITAALIAKRTQLKDVDWVVVPLARLEAAGYDIVNTPHSGQSLDSDVNRGHYDLRHLTARRLLELLEILTPESAEGDLPKRVSVLSLELARELRAAEQSGRYRMQDAKLREQVDDILEEP